MNYAVAMLAREATWKIFLNIFAIAWKDIVVSLDLMISYLLLLIYLAYHKQLRYEF